MTHEKKLIERLSHRAVNEIRQDQVLWDTPVRYILHVILKSDHQVASVKHGFQPSLHSHQTGFSTQQASWSHFSQSACFVKREQVNMFTRANDSLPIRFVSVGPIMSWLIKEKCLPVVTRGKHSSDNVTWGMSTYILVHILPRSSAFIYWLRTCRRSTTEHSVANRVEKNRKQSQ